MSQINLPSDLVSLERVSQATDNKGNICLKVKSKKIETPLHKCGKHATKRYGFGPEITIRHLPILETPVYLKIKPVRYQCDDCEEGPTIKSRQFATNLQHFQDCIVPNNRTLQKSLKRRCYGFMKTSSLFQRLQLDSKGFEVHS